MSLPATSDNCATPGMSALASSAGLTTVRAMPAQRRKSSPIASTPTTNALAHLILKRKNELGLTWQELAARGGFTSHSVLYSLAKKKVHASVPRPETIRRTAKALGVPVDVVKAAAVEASGYTLQDVTTTLDAAADVRVWALAAEKMTEADRKRITAFVSSFLDEQDR